ncbi:MAG: class I mannose-6-phosphate isomerase [Clostridia bacterium]|nr:class I mannose-6-phosphate isomerase [Clostridia bacterium]
MKITKTTPAFKDYIWGGTKLKTVFHKESPLAIVAESWELAAHKDGTSGFAGETFDLAYLFEHDRALIGTDAARFERFPMIIKLIDAKDNLSVQVHPSDAYALAKENSYGKTEMWYVAEAEEGAGLYVGFNRDLTEDEFRTLIAENRLQEALNFIPVKPGEWYFIEAGTVHAIGKGVVIAEIQQNSNLTYRLYDYGRVGADGKPRELHVEKGVKVSKLTKYVPDKRTSCEYFSCESGAVAGEKTLVADEKSFVAVILLDGALEVEGKTYAKGDTIFVPAGYGAFTLRGEAKVIFVKI